MTCGSTRVASHADMLYVMHPSMSHLSSATARVSRLTRITHVTPVACYLPHISNTQTFGGAADVLAPQMLRHGMRVRDVAACVA